MVCHYNCILSLGYPRRALREDPVNFLKVFWTLRGGGSGESGKILRKFFYKMVPVGPRRFIHMMVVMVALFGHAHPLEGPPSPEQLVHVVGHRRRGGRREGVRV